MKIKSTIYIDDLKHDGHTRHSLTQRYTVSLVSVDGDTGNRFVYRT